MDLPFIIAIFALRKEKIMDFDSIKKFAFEKGYELITSQDGKRFGLIPIYDTHCMWNWFDNLEQVFNNLRDNSNVVLVEGKKSIYYFNDKYCSLRTIANHLTDIGIEVLVFNVKKGEHKCKIFCKDKKINLEDIIINVGTKKMGFSKISLPFENEWSGYYVGGYTK